MEVFVMSSSTAKRVLSAVAGMCAIAALSLPATAFAQNANNAEALQAYASSLEPHHFAYSSDAPAIPPPRSASIKARAQRLLKGEDGPLMYCDKDGYRCNPNPAYYGDSAYQYQPYPYYYYADGFTNYSFPDVPLMGGF
jgi:hypothetical protein